MEAVLEDVSEWHGGSGKAMNKQRLKLSLHEMQAYQRTQQCLQLRCIFGCGRVDVRADSKHQWMYENRAQILDEEDGPPRNLCSKILHIDCALIA